jgi:hypothetical protein
MFHVLSVRYDYLRVADSRTLGTVMGLARDIPPPMPSGARSRSDVQTRLIFREWS